MTSTVPDVLDATLIARDLVGMAEQIPPIDRFLCVEDLHDAFHRLAAAHPEQVRAIEIGRSRLGDSIWCFQIGQGRLDHVVVGGIHPNEPIGGWTALHLATTLCTDTPLRDGLDATWHVIPCIDPDGTRLNEGWFDGPFQRDHYSRHFYRSAPDEQVEWTFPFSYKRARFDRPLPETEALMHLIDRVRPSLLTTLHNGEFGGAYFYLSRRAPGLERALGFIPPSLGVPLDIGEPEAPYIRPYSAAIYEAISMPDAYDYFEALGFDPVNELAGESSSAYAGRHGTFTLVTEVPYWTHSDSSDSSLSNEMYADVLARQSARVQETADVLTTILDRSTREGLMPSAFLRASAAFIPMLARVARTTSKRALSSAAQRPATVAERFSCNDVVHSFRLRYGGMLLRALDVQLAAGLATAAIRADRQLLEDQFMTWCGEADEESPGTLIAIERLVGIQFAAILAAARYLGSGDSLAGR